VSLHENVEEIDFETIIMKIEMHNMKSNEGSITAKTTLDIIEKEVPQDTFVEIRKQIGNYLLLQELSNLSVDEEDIEIIIEGISEKIQGGEIDWEEIIENLKELISESEGVITMEDIMDFILVDLKSEKYDGVIKMEKYIETYLLQKVQEDPAKFAEYQDKKAEWNKPKHDEDYIPALRGPSPSSNLRGSKPPRPDNNSSAEPGKDGKPLLKDEQEPRLADEEVKSKIIEKAGPLETEETPLSKVAGIVGGLAILFFAFFFGAYKYYSSYSMKRYQDMNDDEENEINIVELNLGNKVNSGKDSESINKKLIH